MTDLNLGLIPNKSEIGGLTLDGRNTFFGANRRVASGVAGGYVIAQADKGQCLLCRKIVVPTGANQDTSPVTSGWQTILLIDGGGVTRYTLPFFNFSRDNSFGAAGLQAVPDRPYVWEPQMPLIVPSTWKANASAGVPAGGDAFQINSIGIFGMQLADTDARTLGFQPAFGNAAQDTAGVLNYRTIQNGDAFTNTGNVTLAPAIVGKRILVTDILCRLQPTAGAALVRLEDTAGAIIKNFAATNKADFRQWDIKPKVYLPDGVGLRINVSANAQNRGSIVVLGRYVDTADVPRNAWHAHITTGFPSPNATFFSGGAGVLAGRRSVGILKAAPGRGYKHIVEGYAADISKDATSPSTELWAAFTTGDATGATLITDAGGTTRKLLSPIFNAGSHDQDASLIVDNLNVSCVPSVGAVLFEMTAMTNIGGDVVNADADIDSLSVLCWGRTVEGHDKTADSDITWLKGLGVS